jgi:hypothetical protein
MYSSLKTLTLTYCDGFTQRIARQRLSKQARNTRGQQYSRRGVFYVVRATQRKCFLCDPRHATVDVFSVWSEPRNSTRVGILRVVRAASV